MEAQVNEAGEEPCEGTAVVNARHANWVKHWWSGGVSSWEALIVATTRYQLLTLFLDVVRKPAKVEGSTRLSLNPDLCARTYGNK